MGEEGALWAQLGAWAWLAILAPILLVFHRLLFSSGATSPLALPRAMVRLAWAAWCVSLPLTVTAVRLRGGWRSAGAELTQGIASGLGKVLGRGSDEELERGSASGDEASGEADPSAWSVTEGDLAEFRAVIEGVWEEGAGPPARSGVPEVGTTDGEEGAKGEARPTPLVDVSAEPAGARRRARVRSGTEPGPGVGDAECEGSVAPASEGPPPPAVLARVPRGCPGHPGSRWTQVASSELPDSGTYEAWRRPSADGKGSEYLSRTITFDVSAEEMMDFYLDDDARGRWDGMLRERRLLTGGSAYGPRGQAVRWVRRFPVSFITPREYILARRAWRGGRDTGEGAEPPTPEAGGPSAPPRTLYCVTKATEHDAAPASSEVVRVSQMRSCWRTRDLLVADPGDSSGAPRRCCETLLLHYEDLGVSDRLARVAVRVGMVPFVKSMGAEVRRFVADRRRRLAPHDRDPEPFGVRDGGAAIGARGKGDAVEPSGDEPAAPPARPVTPRRLGRGKVLALVVAGTAIGFGLGLGLGLGVARRHEHGTARRRRARPIPAYVRATA